MKIAATIGKILAAVAAIAGAVYLIATYGDAIVAWAKKFLGCTCCCDEECECCENGECTCEEDCECCQCEEAAEEEAPAEECECACEEAAAEEEAPAEEAVTEADFEA